MSRSARPAASAACVLLSALLAASAFHARPAAAQPQVAWRELGAPARADGAMVWDSRRGRALLFGGDGAFATPYASPWQFLRTPRPHWEPLVTTPDGPPLRSGVSAVYDSVGDRVLLFGGRPGFGDVGTNELWQLRLDEPVRWLQLQVAPGPIPAPRYDASMILDRDRRLVLYGGDGAAFQDAAVWILPLTEPALRWQQLDEYELGPGPGPRMRHGAAYSSSAHQMLVFGGEAKFFSPQLGTYGYQMCAPLTFALSLTQPIHWVPALANPGARSPNAEVGGALVADAMGRSAWLVPGLQGLGSTPNDPTDWRYDFAQLAWTRGHPGFGGPGTRGGIASCLDRTSGDLLIHGGSRSLFEGYADEPLAETWALTVGSVPGWVGLCRVPGVADAPWSDARAHLDAERRQLVTWTHEGVWTCDIATDDTWHLEPVSPGDGPQFSNPMSTIDPVRRKLLVFGGEEFTNGRWFDRDADRLWSWALDGTGPWSSTTIEGAAPSGISGTQCAFDPARARTLALPSIRHVFATLDTIPVLELAGDAARWTRLPVGGEPPYPRSDATMIVDPIHDRLVLHGGVTSFNGDGAHALDLSFMSLGDGPRWQPLTASPLPYQLTARSGLAVDLTLDRILLQGGVGLTAFGIGQSNALQAAAFDHPSAWVNLDPAGQSPMMGGGPLFFDAVADRMLWWNGRQLWELTWFFSTPAPYGAAVVNADAGGVHIRWPGQLTAPYSAAVDRSADGGRTWTRLRSVAPDADGSLAFTDADPPAGAPATYRATIERGGVTHVLGTASTVLGNVAPAALTLAAPRPNPSRDDVVLELATPRDASVTIELFDVSGRRAAPAVTRVVSAGTNVFSSPLARGLEPGLYVLRVSDGARKVERRLAVVR